MRPTRPGDEAHTWFGKAEASMFGCDDQIACERYLKASTQGNAVHRRDDRLAALEVSRDPPKQVEPVHQLFSPGAYGSRCLQLFTGRERAQDVLRQNFCPA